MKSVYLMLSILVAVVPTNNLFAQNSPLDANVNSSQSVVVGQIVEVSHAIQTSNPPILRVTAKAELPTGGYSNFVLSRAVYNSPPSDGIQDYYFAAEPPAGFATMVISYATATNVWSDYPEWVKGVRVHGVGNGTITKSFDDSKREDEGEQKGRGTIVVGTSNQGSLSEAIAEVEKQIDTLIEQSGAADAMAEWKLLSISGQRGGIAGLKTISVKANVVITP